ncbi:collagen alpha-1(XII) chain isoform X1 [Lingula anatina]|uniref:Collagen alpha-1(XII) chain isoform X1 n=1 Tax=Lingula anatina TaxID=7574 RepID=A0A1S3IST2_LINAN|nr:collagen alpha-1(XII) chain isoform X1 [Lingula anatina]|eukprot:XP_013400996.1 collagen alpha-1(XII) chain isoform X1 [Lingula anatina]
MAGNMRIIVFYSLVALSFGKDMISSLPAKRAKGCSIEGDIAFVVDNSNSIGHKNWETQLRFIEELVRGFVVGPNDVHIALLTYSTGYKIEFHLKEYETKEEVLARIRDSNYTGGSTGTDRGIRMMRIGIFNPRNRKGPRTGIPHVGIVVTDGCSDNPNATVSEARLAKTENIIMFAVGIGSETRFEELIDIATRPKEQHVFHVGDFDALASIQEVILQEICNALCPKNWTASGKKCYYVSSTALSYAEAGQRCVDLHYSATLATAKTKIEYKTITKMIYTKTGYNFSYYIGLDNERSGGADFIFADNSTSVLYSEWISEVPSGQRQGCVMLDKTHSFMWDVTECSVSLPFVCEIDKTRRT